MAIFTLTDYGQTAMTAAMAGETEITITSAKTSDSTELTTDAYPDFVNTVQTVTPSGIALKTDTGTSLVTAVFTNSSVATAYQIKAVGLYATCAGSYRMSTPRLYGYCILDNPDSMPLPTVEPISFTYLINTKVSNTSAITIEMTDGAYASASDFYKLTNLVHTNEANSVIVRTNNTTASTERAGYNWLQEVAVQGMTSKHWVSATVSSGTYNGSYAVESAADKLRLWFVTKPGTSVCFDVTYFPTYS